MAFSPSTENAVLKLIFNATAWANFADNAATAPLTNLYMGLHTNDPTSGNQSTNEATYTGYARAAVARSSAGFTVATNTVVPAANIDFPAGTGGSDSITNFSVGQAGTGSTGIVIAGTVSPSPLTTGNGITPRLTTSTTITLT
jgi:hypothetical protein